MTSLQFKFDNTDLKHILTAHPYQAEGKEWDNLVFEPFPTASDILVLTGDPYTNNPDNDRTKTSYDTARNWGDFFQSTSAIYFEAYTESGEKLKRYAIKAAFNTEMVNNDFTPCFKGLKYLISDAKFYGEHLHTCDSVPKHYGLWRAETGSWGGVMLFTVMDWGGYSWDEFKDTEHNNPENRIIIGRTVELLHDYGVRHGQLDSDHHMLFDPAIRRCLLVDFSQARDHVCFRSLPILPIDAGNMKEECHETFNLMYNLNFMDYRMHPTPETKTWKAIRFLQRYRGLFPRLSNKDALMVQRRHFFDDRPLLENLDFGFGKDGKLVIIHNWAESGDEVTERLSDKFINALLSE